MTASGISEQRLSRRRLLALAAAGAASAAALRLPSWPEGVAAAPVRQVLGNGLTVIIEQRNSANTLAVQLGVRAGVRDDAVIGANAVVVRSMLNGTQRHPDLQRAAALVGGTFTITAGTEVTRALSLVPSGEADLAFDLISDAIGNFAINERQLTSIKQVVAQGFVQRRTSPDAVMADLFMSRMFAGHPVGRPVNGTPESLAALTVADVTATYRQLWGAQNMVLVIVGRIEPEDALAKAERSFGRLPGGSVNQRTAVPMAAISEETVTDAVGESQTQYRLGVAAPGRRDPDTFPLLVLDRITGAVSGRMFRELRTRRGLAYSAFSAYQRFTDAGSYFAVGAVEPRNVEPAIEVVRNEFERLTAEPPSEEELADAISQIVGEQILASEANMDRASSIAGTEILGDPPIEKSLAQIRAVTAADVQRVARQYVDLRRSLLFLVGPPAV